ncbi:uncharacterized protein A1O9_01217 [Exophiala aquamarina CBS 119918]|uniref:Kelch repeat-containing protein n=1 Tax=Exophiala aquamarina CBS 119918 TaxID=1182545 RepID=A0A072Q5P4_9EURO|nr:uncharacterized protein A1O9_01217 [Exophiala aquamarina CBS 119918]KEF63240.1 hypothetical protein A1O9_01217 [Exophiala aquamarina CBS 119918]
MRSSTQTLTIVAGLVVRLACAVDVQQNYTICNWARLRAGAIRDSVYLDGGLLWWQTAFADGTTPVVSSDGNVAGDMFRLNFSTLFDTTKTNLSALFEKMSKAGGAGNNIAPNYVDGTMFTNDGELYLYGGLPRLTDSVAPQSESSVLGYEAFQYGTDRPSWSPGFYQGNLPDSVTRYISNGAGTSAPSENLGFYFSGMRAPEWDPIFYEDSSANVTAKTLITVDMSTMRSEKWTNTTLPDNIPPRANAELAWVPVSEKGVLVAIGGVTAPEEIWATGLNDSQTSQSREQSPNFMTSLPVYDVASGDWYLQNTTGEAPGQLTEFCSVVAPAKDSSSFNIYIYGGYDGLNAGDVPSDDVWVLSIPSFTWIKAYTGTGTHGRSGHYCVAPYPDQMLVIGGVYQNQANCVEGGIIQVFNLNTLEFQNTYDPVIWSDYKVPTIVSKAIGGDASGGATNTAIWSDNALGGIFSQKYPRQMTHYYPYESNNSSALNGTSSDPPSGSSGISHGAIIGISVAAGTIFCFVLILCALLIRRRRIIRSTSSEKSVASGNSRVSRWLNGATFAAAKSKHDSISPPPMQQAHNYAHISEESTPPLQPQRHEMAGTERPKPPYELATDYNNQQHPRHSTIPDYAYNAAYGHTHSDNSQSTSSGEYRPSTLNSDSLNGASPLRTVRYPAGPTSAPGQYTAGPHEDVSDPSSQYGSSSSGTNETIAWPFPAATNRWRTHRARVEREGGSESSSLQPIIMEESRPEQQQQQSRDARGLGGDGYGHGYTTHHANDSAASGVGTLPSPVGFADSGHDGNPHQRSLFDTISPVNSTPDRRVRP